MAQSQTHKRLPSVIISLTFDIIILLAAYWFLPLYISDPALDCVKSSNALIHSFIHSFLGRCANHDHVTSSLKHIIKQTNIQSNCLWCTHVRQQSGNDS